MFRGTPRRSTRTRAVIGLVAAGGLLVALAPGTAQALPSAGGAQAERLAPPPVATRTVTATVHFESGKSYLSSYSQRILVRLMRSLPAGAVVQSTKVIGYVQARTAWDNGRALGTARAVEVRTHLRALGLGGRIDIASGGIFGNTDLSRRAVVTITYRDKPGQTLAFAQPEDMTLGDDDMPLQVAATSGLRVTVRSTTTSVCTVLGTPDQPVVHAVAVGTCHLVATQPGNAVYSAAASVTRTLTVDPQHISPPAPESYDVMFSAQGGTVEPTSTTWTEGDDPIELPTATREGFTFDGWYTTVVGGRLIGEAGDQFTPEEDVFLYAHWTAIPAAYDVTYSAQQGTVEATGATWTEGDDALVLPTPTRDGFTFDGWFTAATEGTLVGDAGDDFTPDADVTLYAHWTAVVVGHTVTFHANYADGPASTTQQSDEAAALTANPFTGPSGLTFAGWATEAGGAVVYAGGAQYDFSASIDLYAVWGYQVTVYAEWWGQQNNDLYYCGRADGNCTADNVTHIVFDNQSYTRQIVVFPNQDATSDPLDGFEISVWSPGWGIGVSGGAAFDPALTTDTWYWTHDAGYVHINITGNATVWVGMI